MNFPLRLRNVRETLGEAAVDNLAPLPYKPYVVIRNVQPPDGGIIVEPCGKALGNCLVPGTCELGTECLDGRSPVGSRFVIPGPTTRRLLVDGRYADRRSDGRARVAGPGPRLAAALSVATSPRPMLSRLRTAPATTGAISCVPFGGSRRVRCARHLVGRGLWDGLAGIDRPGLAIDLERQGLLVRGLRPQQHEQPPGRDDQDAKLRHHSLRKAPPMAGGPRVM